MRAMLFTWKSYIRSSILLVLFVVFTGQLYAQSADELAIKRLLDAQTKAWNKGDINEFMKGYWRNDSLSFVGKNGATYGYETTLQHYQKSYPDTAAMGKLHFNLLQLKSLSPQYYYVIGKWHLQRTIGDLQGHFTLLFKRINNRWLIVSDHSS